MTKEDKLYWDNWAETHVLIRATFWWHEKDSESTVRLEGKTYNQALAVAKEFGYKEPKWYKPWTWRNGVVTVG